MADDPDRGEIVIDATPPPASGSLWSGRPAERDSDAPEGSLEPRSGPSRRRVLVLAGLLVLGLAGAAVVGTAVARIAQQQDATLEPPARVGGLVRDDSAAATEAADYLRAALGAGIELDQTVSAVYHDPTGPDRGVLFIGGTALLFSPGRELSGIFDLLTDDAGRVTGIRELPAGELGGVLRCGETATADGPMAVCGWADHGSIAVALFPTARQPIRADSCSSCAPPPSAATSDVAAASRRGPRFSRKYCGRSSPETLQGDPDGSP